MRITSVRSMVLRCPLGETIQDSFRAFAHQDTVVVELLTDENVVGVGFTYTLDVSGNAIATVIDEEISPLLVGEDPLAIEAIFQKLWWRTNAEGRRGLIMHAISAVDVALWDLKGKALGLSVRSLLGACRNSAPAYACCGWLGQSAEDAARDAARWVERGFSAVKIKVGSEDGAEDVRRVRTVRQTLGPDVALMIDANQKWRPADAIDRARRLLEYDVRWLEEPLIAENIDGHARVVGAGLLPVAVGENLSTAYEFFEYVRQRAADVLQPDAGRIGVSQWMRVAQVAAAADLPVASHAFTDVHVQLLMCAPTGTWLEFVPAAPRLFTEPARITHGIATPPDGPGLGLTLDPTVVSRFRIR